MAEHHASVIIQAPVHQTYMLFTHFNDFPKFMHFVKEVTYYDDRRSHWVVQLAGYHEWDAVNEDWIENRQIGWRSISGLKNRGRVIFTAQGAHQTVVDVYISYQPPLRAVGELVENLNFDSRFQHALQRDLEHFAHMVEQTPAGVEDPMWSHYLFHPECAVATGTTTQRQNIAMKQDPMMDPQALQERESAIQRDRAAIKAAEQERQARRAQDLAQQQRVAQEQRVALERQAALKRRAREELEAARLQQLEQERIARSDPEVWEALNVQATLGGRNASLDRAPFGDRDARCSRFPSVEQDIMGARIIAHNEIQREKADTETQY